MPFAVIAVRSNSGVPISDIRVSSQAAALAKGAVGLDGQPVIMSTEAENFGDGYLPLVEDLGTCDLYEWVCVLIRVARPLRLGW